MPSFDREFFNLGYLDTLSYRHSFIHRLDPRAKLIITMAFTVTVVSFPKHELKGLIPFFLLPVVASTLGDIPMRFILKKILLVSPFVIFIGIFNPLLDPATAFTFFGIEISNGWVSFFSILMKFMLTVSTALLLIATTSFPGVCFALRKLGMPEIFVSQLLFLYRYLFVMAEETMKIVRAREMRSFDKRGRGLKVFTSMAGVLFIRTVERAERIYQAMLSRGFSGSIPSVKQYRLAWTDVISIGAALSVFSLLRLYDIPGRLGTLIARLL